MDKLIWSSGNRVIPPRGPPHSEKSQVFPFFLPDCLPKLNILESVLVCCVLGFLGWESNSIGLQWVVFLWVDLSARGWAGWQQLVPPSHCTMGQAQCKTGKFLPHPSFYPCPNISDRFPPQASHFIRIQIFQIYILEDEMNIFQFLLAIFMQKRHLWINSGRKRGRAELF